MIYFSLILGNGGLARDRYLNFSLVSIVEVPGVLIAIVALKR